MKKRIALVMCFAAILLASCTGKKDVAVIERVEDLSGKRIGVQGGTTGEVYVEENIANAQIFSFKSFIDAALDLQNGRLDAVVIDKLPAEQIAGRIEGLEVAIEGLAFDEYAIAVKKGNTELLNSINRTIERLHAEGKYTELVSCFMPVEGEIVVPASVKAENPKRVVKMGTNAAFPPFEYVMDNKIVGFDISFSEYVAAGLGAELEVVDMAFDSLIAALTSGAVDFVAAGMSVTEERKKNVDFSMPYFQSEQVVLVRKN